MAGFHNDAIFWIEVEKIKPNPYQPRKEFDQARLTDLAESIRQYGVLQPLTVTRNEIVKEDGGITVEYELIAGERRHRASQLAGLSTVPVLIRSGQQDAREKLELAIIENLQREDLNPIDRARAFGQLVEEFNFKHTEIAKKVGKSREYVSNSIRLLGLPDDIQDAIVGGRIREGHARPILMLSDRPEQQKTLFKEMLYRKLSVRQAEAIARRIAYDKVRKKEHVVNPEIVEMEGRLAESLGTRVRIEQSEVGGRVVIDFFSPKDLEMILGIMQSGEVKDISQMLNNHIEETGARDEDQFVSKPHLYFVSEQKTILPLDQELPKKEEEPIVEENKEDDLYSISNFSL